MRNHSYEPQARTRGPASRRRFVRDGYELAPTRQTIDGAEVALSSLHSPSSNRKNQFFLPWNTAGAPSLFTVMYGGDLPKKENSFISVINYVFIEP